MTLSTTSDAQKRRMLEALIDGPVSTQRARTELDILSPAPRVYDLRKEGHEIITRWIVIITVEGTKHTIGEYVLIKLAKGYKHGKK